MRVKRFLVLLTAGIFASAYGEDVTTLADRLVDLSGYNAHVSFEVFLPQSEDPVTYDISLQADAAPDDTLSPCSYVIRWTTTTRSGDINGFSAYFDGNHYRYRNNKLQEYHIDANPTSFLPLGPGSQEKGVQQTVQFADLLPQYIGAHIHDMLTDSAYIVKFTADTMIERRPAMVLEGVKRYSGYDNMIFTYVFDRETGLPVLTELENSPGSISEQIVTVRYSTADTLPTIAYTEEALIDQWPEAFERYRESTFRTENLVNAPLPKFSAKVYGSDQHYSHHSDETLPSTTIIVVLDPEVSTTAETVAAVRHAVDMLPMTADVLWAFNTNRESDIADAVGNLRRGETALVSAGTLIRNCGVTLYPTIIIAGRDAKVKTVIPGFNKELADIVIQKAVL